MYAGNQSSMFNLLDERMQNDKNIYTTMKTAKVSLRASAAGQEEPCGNVVNRL